MDRLTRRAPLRSTAQDAGSRPANARGSSAVVASFNPPADGWDRAIGCAVSLRLRAHRDEPGCATAQLAFSRTCGRLCAGVNMPVPAQLRLLPLRAAQAMH